ncbi:MAG TPA: tRNA cyclic N6-threonylcarbamoyladenosine(37) synthase TcdA [Methylophilaceae bacterium]|nr:tRNA cyclic N6-threonylcarbamoyladenosine(37) synthase TcdA [Methylophilaceae bacterium]HQR59740.1 tRNA cyclic N6-threonylcarbamoyladenosine(37) synthase TcdA [Methylophilaceae bacterium]
MTQEADFERRFGGIRRLYGNHALERFRQAHVCVVGVGGVGSWAAEALARSAVGRITLIDLDNVAESNVNRQIHALGNEFGKAKVTAMAERIHAINLQCQVTQVEDFVTPDNLDAMLSGGYDFIIDAIDSAKTKAAMIAWCKRHKVKLIVSGGAGGRVDPSRIQLADLSRTIQDPLLSRVRTLLRREFGFPKDPKKKFGVECVFSSEPLQQPKTGAACDVDVGTQHPTGLNCAGYGSSMTVTATVALLAVASGLRRL